MDNERYSTWNGPPPIPRGESQPSRGMPRSAGARSLPDLNFSPPEDPEITEEPSNPQRGPSNPEEGPNRPKQDPPDSAFFRDRVPNPRPFFTGKIADALEGMRILLVRMRRRFKHKKEGGTPKRKYTRTGQPKSEGRKKRNKRTPGDDMET